MIEEEQICFKVLRQEIKTGKLISAIAKHKSKKIYSKEKYVKAPKWLQNFGYHLLVFSSLNDAVLFILHNIKDIENPKIFKCSCRKEIKKLPPKLSVSSLEIGIIYNALFYSFPTGTRMFEEIKLLEEVDWTKPQKSLES